MEASGTKTEKSEQIGKKPSAQKENTPARQSTKQMIFVLQNQTYSTTPKSGTPEPPPVLSTREDRGGFGIEGMNLCAAKGCKLL